VIKWKGRVEVRFLIYPLINRQSLIRYVYGAIFHHQNILCVVALNTTSFLSPLINFMRNIHIVLHSSHSLRDRMKATEEERNKFLAESTRRSNPKTPADFAVLYNELNAWRQAEMEKIKVSARIVSTNEGTESTYVLEVSKKSSFCFPLG
jgi:hypothetical protein